MKSLTKVLMMALTLTAMLFSTACYAQTGEATSFKDRLQNIQENDGKQLKFAFYLDSEGHANFEQKVLDEIVASLQAKVPSYVTIQGDGQFLADLDLYRETKYDDLMAEMQEKNPQFAVLGDYAESGRKVKLTKPILDEFFQNNEYDGLVLARIDVAQVKIATISGLVVLIRRQNWMLRSEYLINTLKLVMFSIIVKGLLANLML